jgi:hypothetical protein
MLRVCRCYSTLNPVAFTIARQRAASAATIAASRSDVAPVG